MQTLAKVIDLTKRASHHPHVPHGGGGKSVGGKVWGAAQEAMHPRDLANGRFRDAAGSSHQAVADLLHGMVQEHGGQNTKLGKALLEAIGRDAAPKAPRARAEAKAPTPTSRNQGWKADAQQMYESGATHEEVAAKLGPRPEKPLRGASKPPSGDAKAIADELHAIPVESGNGGLDRARALLRGKTAAELKDIAHAAGPTVGKKTGTKAELTNKIIEGTLGFRQRSKAIGGWGEDANYVPDPTGLGESRSFLSPAQAERTGLGLKPAAPKTVGRKKVLDQGTVDELGSGGPLLGDRPGERSLTDVIAKPSPEDRDLFDQLTKDMTLAQLKQMASERQAIFPTSGNKESRRVQLREHLFGFKLNSQAIRNSEWSSDGGLPKA